MKNLELSVDQNLFGQIDFNAVKIALEKDEMEEIVGGYGWRGCSNIDALTAAAAGCAITGGPWGGVAALCMIGYFGC